MKFADIIAVLIAGFIFFLFVMGDLFWQCFKSILKFVIVLGILISPVIIGELFFRWIISL